MGGYSALAAPIVLGYGLAKRNEIYNWSRSKFKSKKRIVASKEVKKLDQKNGVNVDIIEPSK